MAFTKVESGGRVATRTTVRFEPHIFCGMYGPIRKNGKKGSRPDLYGGPHYSGADKVAYSSRYNTKSKAEWAAHPKNKRKFLNGRDFFIDKNRPNTNRAGFDRAFKLDPKQAIKATSWGQYQVLGWALLEAYDNDPKKAIAAYDANPMAAGDQMIVSWFKQQFRKAWKRLAFTELDFEKMVKIYNGPAQVKQYAPKLKKYYNQLSNISEGNTEAPKTNPPSVSPASKSPPCADSTGAVVTDPPGAVIPPATTAPPSVVAPTIGETIGEIGPATGGVRDQAPVLKAALAGDYSKKDYKGGKRSGLPCSVFLALWVTNQLGKIPKASQQRNWRAWNRKDSRTMSAMNLKTKKFPGYDGCKSVTADLPNVIPGKCGPGAGDNILWAQAKLGGSVTRYTWDQTKSQSKGGQGIVPKLTKNRWHIVQHWAKPKSKGGYAGGHIYLIFWDGGKYVRKVDNSRAMDYRDRNVSLKSWYRKGRLLWILTTNLGPQSVAQKRASERVASQIKKIRKGVSRTTNPTERD